jgi:hypothetical protein
MVTMAKALVTLPNACDWCVDVHKGTETREFCHDQRHIRLILCEWAANKFDADLYKWEKMGEELPAHKPPIKFGERNGKSVAPIPIPKRVVLETVEEEEAVTVDSLHYAQNQLPPGADTWSFSSHALERLVERHVTGPEVLWAAIQPERTSDGKLPETREHVRGTVMAVVVPHRRLIVTLYRLTNLDERQEA